MNENHAMRIAAYYWEICLLQRLLHIGLIEQEAYDGIQRIAAEDYGVVLNCV